MAKNRFEQVDEAPDDAITLTLGTDGDMRVGTVTCPAALSGGRYAEDMVSERLNEVEAYRSAIKLANEIKAPVVVVDPQNLWKEEWGDLYREADGS